jgi:hypothetical protein
MLYIVIIIVDLLNTTTTVTAATGWLYGAGRTHYLVRILLCYGLHAARDSDELRSCNNSITHI